MSLLSSLARPCRGVLIASRPFPRYHSTAAAEGQESEENKGSSEPINDDYAWNDVEKKKGKIKPIHTVEEQIAYMKSKAFQNAYKGLPIHKWYRRNIFTQVIIQPPPRLICIDRDGRLKLNNACPICRDEYLFFDYRNPELIKQFLMPGTDDPMELLKTGLCREQYANLRAQLLKAREYGTIEFSVEFRTFDYSQWYPDWKNEEHNEEEDSQAPSRRSPHFESMFPTEDIRFPEHILNSPKRFEPFWERYDAFARKGK